MDTITIKRLARELNVSVSTVSKALQDSYEISPETKRRVWELARQLNYVPNPYASSLRRKRSKTIGVVIPEVTDSFFALAIKGIESVVQAKGYHTLIYLTYESYGREQAILQDFQSGRVDGVIMSLSAETAGRTHLEVLPAKGVPVVLFDRVSAESGLTQITTNDFESGHLATHHLLDGQCRRIAFLSISESLSISSQRLEGYKKALADAGMAIEPTQMITGTNEPEHNRRLLLDLFRSDARPDGVVASVEKLAILAYQVCHELALAIPDQVKIISFSNLETASLLRPSLTTITQPAFDMGKAAASALFQTLEGKTPNPALESRMLPSVLVVRESTGCPMAGERTPKYQE